VACCSRTELKVNARRVIRIAVVINMIAPYTTRIFERLANHRDCDLLVLYETPMEPDRSWRPETDLPYEHALLSSWTLDLARLAVGGGYRTTYDTYLFVPRRPLAPLVRFSPDVVVGAGAGIWSSPANLAALVARGWRGWAFVPWWGSFKRARPTWPRRLAEPWVRFFVRSADAWMAYGTRSARHVVELGADPERTVISPIVPPIAARASAAAARNGAGVAAREPRYLFVGRLIERKGIRLLLEAFRDVDKGELWIVGDGPLRNEIEAASRPDSHVRLFGHLEGRELATLYRKATVFVLPSLYELWGLVVNEALEYGLPVITTDEVGAADDLIDAGVNGLVVPTGSTQALAQAMRRVAEWTPEQRRRCGRHSRDKLAAWSLDRTVEGFVRASSLALEHRRRL
jgi:glycosyltransferase involved in cell wall biosynthesis